MNYDPKQRYHFTNKNKWIFSDVFGSVNISQNMKPFGLWYGFGLEWIDWVIREEPCWMSYYPYSYTLHLNDERIFKIGTSEEEIEDLYETLKEEDWCPIPRFDWDKLKKEYSGIEFFPYHKKGWLLDNCDIKRAMLYSFVCSLDVASGCIWDSRAILDVDGPFEVKLENFPQS